MAISNAVQRGSQVYAYDLRGKLICVVPAGFGGKDGLKGYTSASINVQNGDCIYTYNERGQLVAATASS